MSEPRSVRHPSEERTLDASVRMPREEQVATSVSMVIGELVGNFEEFLQNEEQIRASYPWATRFVLGYPLPKWQRPLVWSPEQKIRFITSIWCGIDIGSYLLNDCAEVIEEQPARGIVIFREFSNVLLDGQQRMSSIEEYLLGAFAVMDTQGTPRLWSELPRIERRRFESTHFSRCTVKSWNEGQLRKIYNLRAFGGTAHRESERA